MFRLSMIRNYPVIFKNKRVGLLLGIRSDLHTKSVSDLIISCGFRGKRIIQSNCVDTIADGFILLRNMPLCSPMQECTEADFVFDTTGLFVGRIMDLVIEESSMTIQALDVCTGYLSGIFSKRIWVFEFEQKSHGEVVIPASFGSGLTEWVKEEKTCVLRQ